MDYLNPNKRRKHLIRLFTGYGLAAVLIALAVVVLLYLVRGYSYQDGVLVRSGMAFISSTPSGAVVTTNGKPNGSTNERLTLLAGKYDINLAKTGYRPWQRTIELAGGMVQRYDYPLLIPDQLTSSQVLALKYRPGIVAESPNRDFLLMSNPASQLKFLLVDLSNPAQPVATTLNLPSNILTETAHGSWQLVEWSADNQHVLLKYGAKSSYEYVVLDTNTPSKSVNLDAAFGVKLAEVQFFNDLYDQYWFYNPTSGKLLQANLSGATTTPFLSHVLAFKAYADNIVLYLTASKTAKNKVRLLWYQSGKNYELADNLPLSSSPDDYLLDLAQYRGDWYAVIGAKTGGSVAVYKNPLSQISSEAKNALPPYWTIKIDKPNYLKFSASTQFILAENNRNVAVFNNYTHDIYSYSVDPLDKPQTNLQWMDGYHLLGVNSGLLQLRDFNDLNQQTLVAADPAYSPFFDTSYRYLFTLVKSGNGVILNSTPLRLPGDM